MVSLYREFYLLCVQVGTTYRSALSVVVYAAIYALCIWVLIRRRREKYVWHILSSTILFTLASLQVGTLFPLFSLQMTVETEMDLILMSPNYSPSLLDSAADSAGKISYVLDTSILLSL
jgi:hypothetical protein